LVCWPLFAFGILPNYQIQSEGGIIMTDQTNGNQFRDDEIVLMTHWDKKEEKWIKSIFSKLGGRLRLSHEVNKRCPLPRRSFCMMRVLPWLYKNLEIQTFSEEKACSLPNLQQHHTYFYNLSEADSANTIVFDMWSQVGAKSRRRFSAIIGLLGNKSTKTVLN